MDDNEVFAFKDQCTSLKDKALFAVLFGGGLRRQEVVNLTALDIFEQHGLLLLCLTNTKTSKLEVMSMPDWAADDIIAWKVEAKLEGTDSLFSYSLEGLHKWFKRKLWAAGISKPYACHSARVVAINQLLRKGIPDHIVQEFSRHKSLQRLQGYKRIAVNPRANPGRLLNYERNDEWTLKNA